MGKRRIYSRQDPKQLSFWLISFIHWKIAQNSNSQPKSMVELEVYNLWSAISDTRPRALTK